MVESATRDMSAPSQAEASLATPRVKTLPTEVVHRIVSYALAAYLDDVIDGPHALELEIEQDFEVGEASICCSRAEMLTLCGRQCIAGRRLTWSKTWYGLRGVAISESLAPFQKRTGVSSAPVVQLLRVSYVVRHVTLEVVAKVFNLRYINDGLGRYEALLQCEAS